MKYLDNFFIRLKRKISCVNEISGNVKISTGVKLRGCTLKGDIFIGRGCKLSEVIIKGNVTIANYTNIWGPNTELFSSIHDITIGSFCSIASNVTIQEYNHDMDYFTTYYVQKHLLKQENKKEVKSKGAINIGNDVWIGTKSVILTGVSIGTGAVIAANSVVTKSVPDYAIVAGNPARILRYRFTEEVKNRLLHSEWWNMSEQELLKSISLLENLTIC